jgi:hypothetical protein
MTTAVAKQRGSKRAVQRVVCGVLACGALALVWQKVKQASVIQQQTNEAVSECFELASDGARKLASPTGAKPVVAVEAHRVNDDGVYSCVANVVFNFGGTVDKEQWTVMGGGGAPYALMSARSMGVEKVDELTLTK